MSTQYIDGFSFGTDLSIVVTNNATGAAVTFDGRMTDFEVTPREKLETSEPIDEGGLVEDRLLPGGYQGTITVDRKSDAFGALYAYLDAQFYANGLRQTFTIESFEPQADRLSVAIYNHTKVVFHGYKPGKWARARVSANVSFVCQQRLKMQ